MAELDALQGRITAALDRIGARIEAARSAPPPADPAEIQRLKAALEDERLATRQLEERVKAIREKQDSTVEELRRKLETQLEASGKLDAELQRLRKANDQLRKNNQALREANEDGVGDPSLINQAMLAELESLRAVRAADTAEAEAILSALRPIVAAATRQEGAI